MSCEPISQRTRKRKVNKLTAEQQQPPLEEVVAGAVDLVLSPSKSTESQSTGKASKKQSAAVTRSEADVDLSARNFAIINIEEPKQSQFAKKLPSEEQSQYYSPARKPAQRDLSNKDPEPFQAELTSINKEAELSRSQYRLIHTGPSIQNLDAVLEVAAELNHISDRVHTLTERIDYLVRKQVSDQLGLYAARFALKANSASQGTTVEDITANDLYGNEISRYDKVSTQTDHDPNICVRGRVVNIQGIVVLIEVEQSNRCIARLSHQVCIVDDDYENPV